MNKSLVCAVTSIIASISALVSADPIGGTFVDRDSLMPGQGIVYSGNFRATWLAALEMDAS
jgi:hypothetical protein